jgi:hypothetical protein
MENRDDQNKNQAGQQGQGQQPAGQEGRTGSDQGAFGTSGGTSFSQGQTDQLDKQDKERAGETGKDEGFVGTSKEKDSSESLVESGETDFAEAGQGATEARTGTGTGMNEDIETGTTASRDAALDDGS